MGDKVELESDEREALRYVKGIKEFYTHLLMFVIFAILLLVFRGPAEPLVMWGLLGWSVGVLVHGLVAYEILNFFGPAWEKRQIEKRLGRNL